MGNRVCAPRICRPLGESISPCCVVLSEEDLLDIYFPLPQSLSENEYGVYVPFWDRAASIYSLQRIHPSNVPIHPFPDGFDLPGENVSPEETPSDLYELVATSRRSYTSFLHDESLDTYYSLTNENIEEAQKASPHAQVKFDAEKEESKKALPLWTGGH